MKVLYFHQHFSTPEGSAGIRSYAMAKKLIKHGHSVIMVCGSYSGGNSGLKNKFLGGKREGLVEGIHVIEFKLAYSNNDSFIKRTGLFFLFAFRSISIAFSQQYDLLFATTTPLTAGIPGIMARWLRGKAFVFEVRDLWPELPKEMGVITNPIILRLMVLLERFTYRSAHRLIGLSPGIVEGIVRHGVKREDVAMIPNGCDLDIFSDKAPSWRPKDVNENDLMAIFSGTHGIANGLNTVLDVAMILKQRKRHDIKIVLVGQGKLKSTLLKRTKQNNLNNVIFHNIVDKRKLAGLMTKTDIGLQILANIPAFYYGTSPNKFFDYIASGLPVLNNYPGWLAVLIEQNQCGFVVPPQQPSAFADALEWAADNREELKIMGEKAKNLAVSKFNRDDLSAQFVNWLEDTQNETSV